MPGIPGQASTDLDANRRRTGSARSCVAYRVAATVKALSNHRGQRSAVIDPLPACGTLGCLTTHGRKTIAMLDAPAHLVLQRLLVAGRDDKTGLAILDQVCCTRVITYYCGQSSR